MRKPLAALLLALPVALLAGCAKGVHYDVKPGEARSRLAGSEVPLMLFGSTATATETAQRGADTIIWRVLDDEDSEMIRLAAHVSPDGEGSRIWTEALPPPGPRHDRVEKGMATYPAIANLYGKVAEEQVASVMQDREFSMAAVTPAMMAATMAMTQQIQQQAMRAASEAQKAERSNIEKAYDDDAHGWSSGGSQSEGFSGKYGEPMDGSEE